MNDLGHSRLLPAAAAPCEWRLLLRSAVTHLLAAGLVLVLLVIIVRFTAWPPVLAVLGLSSLTVLTVALGFRLPAADPDGPPLWRLCHSLGSRESLIPLGLGLGLIVSGLISPAGAVSVVVERYPVLWLIFTFALLSYGLRHSGLFRYLAVRVLVLCHGSAIRLCVGFFLLTSVVTCFTSNDVAVLVMTPLVLELSRASGIRDPRLLLLAGCFIASNTLSMATLFGSPSNIIIALALGLGFWDYLKLMAFPSVIALFSSLLVLVAVPAFRPSGAAAFPAPPAGEPGLSPAMLGQCLLFCGAVAAYSGALGLGWSLWTVSLPFSLLALASVWRLRVRGSGREVRGSWEALGSLPAGITGFALCFFLVSSVVVDAGLAREFFQALVGIAPAWRTAAFLAGTAVLVNLVNDLPASALLGGLLAGAPSVSGPGGTVMVQSVVVSLNLGCYLTPVGALAGLMWFHILRRDGARYGLLVPRPLDLLWYGGLHFLVCGGLMWALLPLGPAVR